MLGLGSGFGLRGTVSFIIEKIRKLYWNMTSPHQLSAG